MRYIYSGRVIRSTILGRVESFSLLYPLQRLPYSESLNEVFKVALSKHVPQLCPLSDFPYNNITTPSQREGSPIHTGEMLTSSVGLSPDNLHKYPYTYNKSQLSNSMWCYNYIIMILFSFCFSRHWYYHFVINPSVSLSFIVVVHLY